MKKVGFTLLILSALAPSICGADPPPKATTAAVKSPPRKLGVSGDTTVPEYVPVQLSPADAVNGSVFDWSVTPEPAWQQEQPDGSLWFTAAPGEYKVTCQALSIVGGKLSKSNKVVGTVTITPAKKAVAGAKAPEVQSSAPVVTVAGPRLVRKLVCEGGSCRWVDVWE